MKKWLISLTVLAITFPAVLMTTACKTNQIHQDLVGLDDNDDETDQANLNRVAAILTKGVDAKNLNVRKEYNDALLWVKAIIQKVDSKVQIELINKSQMTTKLKKNENMIKVKIFIGNIEKTVDMRLLNVSSELSLRIEELLLRWDGKVNGKNLTTYNTIGESLQIIINKIKNYDSGIEVKLADDSKGAKKLKAGTNTINLTFKLDDDKDSFEVKLENVQMSDLDNALNAIARINIGGKVTTATKDEVILRYINNKLTDAEIEGVTAIDLKSKNGDDNILSNSGENKLIITLKNNLNQQQDNEIIMTNVKLFDPVEAIQMIIDAITQKNLVFRLNIGDKEDKLLSQIQNNKDLNDIYEFNVPWVAEIFDPHDDVNTVDETVDESNSRVDDQREIRIKIRVNNISKPLDIKYDVYPKK